MERSKEKVAVTGGLGFIGTHLVDHLLQTDHEVAVLDAAVPTADQAGSGARFLRVDLVHGTEVADALAALAADGYRSLVHLAGSADALHSITEPIYDFSTNAGATATVLTAAARTGWDRAVIASSALVYGRNGSKYRPETELPDPIFPYSASKLAAEAFASALSRWSDLETITARLFTVYGPSADPENSPIEPIQYAARAVRDLPITVLGDPDKKIRDFIHVLDVVEALRIILAKGRSGSTYNVGSGVATSLRDLLDHIENQLGRPVEWHADQSDLSDSYRIVADIGRITRLGFTPGMALSEGLAVALAADRPAMPEAHPLRRPVVAIQPLVERHPDGSAGTLPELTDTDRQRLHQVLTPMSNTRAAGFEVDQVAEVMAAAADEVDAYLPRAVDRVAVYLPSNVVAYSYALFALVPSLFARRVDLRAARIVARQTEQVHEVLHRYARADVELCRMSQSEYLRHTQGADVVVFTGRFDNGIDVARQHPNALFLFFGSGVNPFVVGPDADLDRAAELAVASRMYNSGQDCLCPDALLVHQSRAEEFVERLVDRVGRLRLGDPEDPDADYTPLYYPGVSAQVGRLLTARREHVVHRGVVSERRHVVDPAVLVCDITAPYQVHENFSPVFDVRVYRDEAQVRRWVSAPSRRELALGATVLGADRLADHLERRHWVARDRSLFDADDGNAPFGGYGMKASHVRHLGHATARPLLVSREVATVLGRTSLGRAS